VSQQQKTRQALSPQALFQQVVFDWLNGESLFTDVYKKKSIVKSLHG
jgi:hypothetical protein